MFKNISLEQAFNLIKQDDSIIIIDIRDKEDFQKRHIKNAINLSIYELEKIKKIAPSFESTIIVYCYSGIRSIAAAEKLLELGYINVYNVKKGYR